MTNKIPTTIRLAPDVKSALEKEAIAAGVDTAKYVRSIIDDRDAAEQIARAGIASKQLQTQTDLLLDRLDEIEANLTSANESASQSLPADALATPAETVNRDNVLLELVERPLDLPAVHDKHPDFIGFLIDWIAGLPNEMLQAQAIDLFTAILPRLRSDDPVSVEQSIMRLIVAETNTLDPHHTFGAAVWPWLKEYIIAEDMAIRAVGSDLRIE